MSTPEYDRERTSVFSDRFLTVGRFVTRVAGSMYQSTNKFWEELECVVDGVSSRPDGKCSVYEAGKSTGTLITIIFDTTLG